jgi:hypothetical protein
VFIYLTTSIEPDATGELCILIKYFISVQSIALAIEVAFSPLKKI